MNVSPAGDLALLVDFGDIDARSLHGAAARARLLAGVRNVVPGQSSLLVVFDTCPNERRLVEALGTRTPIETRSRRHDIEVSFHDDVALDLPEFLSRIGLSRDTFLERVETLKLVARYIGFRGGFAYLDGWPRDWAMPRRPTSRPVRAGSFGIAGDVAGFYPIDTPGGWNILGSAGVDLENAFEPGDEIHILPTEKKLAAPPPPRIRTPEVPGIRVRGPLALATNRPFDHELASAAKRAVGSDEQLVVECPMVSPRVEALEDIFVAWADLRGIEVRALKRGQSTEFGKVRDGLRGYIAAGHHNLGATLERTDRLTIRAMRGPHDSPFDTIECEVTNQLDRVGIRLRPTQPIGMEPPAGLPSTGMQCGTLQLHPDGSILAMGPDHPVTGGYLQPMTVVSREVWKLAQLAPGEILRFVSV